jgi:hypothetical protein
MHAAVDLVARTPFAGRTECHFPLPAPPVLTPNPTERAQPYKLSTRSGWPTRRVSDADISDVARPCYFGAMGRFLNRPGPTWPEKSCVRGAS